MITRHRCGKGFTYRRGNGGTIRDRKLRRWIESLVIPPAWVNVEIDPDVHAKIHATGRDSAGRKQYLYNPGWREGREREKFDRIIRFAERLASMRRITGQHLARHDNSREKVLACMESVFGRNGCGSAAANAAINRSAAIAKPALGPF